MLADDARLLTKQLERRCQLTWQHVASYFMQLVGRYTAWEHPLVRAKKLGGISVINLIYHFSFLPRGFFRLRLGLLAIFLFLTKGTRPEEEIA